MSKLQVVLVDDNPVDLELMQRDLARLGADCVLLDGPDACLQYLQGVKRLPDLLVSDVSMPGMDGFELLSTLKQRYPSLPIAIVTGHKQASMTARALRLGAFDFLDKPVVPEKLEAMCQRVQEFHEDSPVACRAVKPVLTRKLTIRAQTRRDLSRHLSRELCQQLTHWIRHSPVDFLKLRVALIEAIENAVTHGNLESTVQSATMHGVAYEAMLQERLKDEHYSKREVGVDMQLDQSGLRITLSNEGPGFDPETIPQVQDADVAATSGRGMFLICTTFDEVSWQDSGRSITMRLHLS